MIEIEGKVVSLDVFEEQFVCNLSACKGACCVEGDSGAPLTHEETEILAKIFPKIQGFMEADGIAAVEAQGTSVVDSDGDEVTPLVDGKHCAYTVFEEGKAGCAIEKAYLGGAIDYVKPVSCHLYPIRVKVYSSYTVLNYDRWEICKPACTLGKELSVPVYRFLEKPIKRAFGESFYAELEAAARLLKEDPIR